VVFQNDSPASPLDPFLAYGQNPKTAKVVPKSDRTVVKAAQGAPSIVRELNLGVLISPPEDHSFLRQDFPATQRAAWETIWIPQPALLGDEQDMHEIATAIRKIQKHAKELA